MAAALLEVSELRKHFPVRKGLFSRVAGQVYALDGVSFQVNQGETFGLVGESGCGKTTVARAILRLTPATGGQVRFLGQDLFSLGHREMRAMRRQMQIIFQDPYASLNPRMTVGAIVGEPLRVHREAVGARRRELTAELLELVGLRPGDATRYPHQFSGGQRQRIGIARALALRPKLIICDEPVSALDVSIQSQILNLLDDLQQRLGLTYIFIAHGLNVIRHVSDHVGVMYLGRFVEMAPVDELYTHPSHPYTEALLSAMPVPDPFVVQRRIVLEGDVPSPRNPPPGCRFHGRCPQVMERCRTDEPALRDIGGGHLVACHRVREGGGN
jgi:oligopeptide/dipeptide ABC transporter ATP-binding protein